MSKCLQNEILENRKQCKAIIQTVLFCEKRNILLHDHCDDRDRILENQASSFSKAIFVMC